MGRPLRGNTAIIVATSSIMARAEHTRVLPSWKKYRLLHNVEVIILIVRIVKPNIIARYKVKLNINAWYSYNVTYRAQTLNTRCQAESRCILHSVERI